MKDETYLEDKGRLDTDKIELDLMSNFEKVRMGITGLRTVLDRSLAAISLERLLGMPPELKNSQHPMIIFFKDADLLKRMQEVSDSGSMARLTKIHQENEWSEAVNKIYEEATYEERILSTINFLAIHLNSTIPVVYLENIPYDCVVAIKDDTLFEFLMTPPPQEA
jgi:hypothetical protein